MVSTGHLLEVIRQRLYGDEGGVTLSDGSNIRITATSTTDDGMVKNPQTDVENGSLNISIDGTTYQIPAYDSS